MTVRNYKGFYMRKSGVLETLEDNNTAGFQDARITSQECRQLLEAEKR